MDNSKEMMLLLKTPLLTLSLFIIYNTTDKLRAVEIMVLYSVMSWSISVVAEKYSNGSKNIPLWPSIAMIIMVFVGLLWYVLESLSAALSVYVFFLMLNGFIVVYLYELMSMVMWYGH